MKKLFFLPLVFCAVSIATFAQSGVEADLSNFRNDKGVCRACIFSSKEGFKNNQPVQCVETVIRNKKAVISFNALSPGTYAVFVFHDTNRNGKMDTNFLGIPSEGYGASGNNLPFAAAPTFEGNSFRIEKVKTRLSIKLRNL